MMPQSLGWQFPFALLPFPHILHEAPELLHGRSGASLFIFLKSGLGFAVVFAGNVASHGIDHDGRAKDDEQHCDDELQAVGNEHRAPGRFTGGDGDRRRVPDGADHGHQPLHQRREGDAEHDDQRREQHLVAAAGDLEEDAQRDENQRGKELIGRAEQRPDVGVADLSKHIAQYKRQNRGEIGIAQKLAPGLGVSHVVHAEQLLEAHPRDTGNGVKTREGKRRDAHGHKDRGGIAGNAEHLKEARDTAAEDLERSAGGGGAIGRRGCTGHTEGEDGKQAFQNHGAVANLEHVLLVFNGLGGCAGGNKAVEAGYRAAGDGDEQDGEHGAELFVVEAREDRQIHRRVRNDQTNDRARDHADEHKGGHVVPGLFQQPHGKHGGEEDVDKGDVAPSGLVENQGAVHAHGKGGSDAQNTDDGFLPAGEIQLLLHKAEDDGEHHEHDGHHAGRAVGLSGVGELGHAVGHGVGVERAGNHIGKRRNDNQAEQPAEQQKQLAAQLADVFFNKHTHGLAFVLDGGVQRAKVRHSTEEGAADQHPQQHRQPAEGGSLNGTGDRACARDRGKLMAEDRPAVGGNVILAVVIFDGGCLRFGVDAPFLSQPAAIERIGGDKSDRRDQHDYKCVHVISLSFLKTLPFANAGSKKEALVLAAGLPDGSPDAKTKADPGTNARREFQLPRYHFACRKTGLSTAARKSESVPR